MAILDEFARDFGYLHKFLDRFHQHVSEAPASSQRDQILALLEGEGEKWRKIHNLLEGKTPVLADIEPTAASEASPEVQGESIPQNAPAAPEKAPQEEVSADWTIGPLISP